MDTPPPPPSNNRKLQSKNDNLHDSLEHIRDFYGLSPAELRLAEALVRHCDLTVAAAAVHVSRNTAKTHLRSIFRKTGCRKQLQLLKLLLTSGRRDDLCSR